MPFHASIAAAKGGLQSMGLSIAAELAKAQIRVNSIAPSLTDTPLAENLLSTEAKQEASAARHPLNKVGSANELASMARLFTLRSGWFYYGSNFWSGWRHRKIKNLISHWSISNHRLSKKPIPVLKY